MLLAYSAVQLHALRHRYNLPGRGFQCTIEGYTFEDFTFSDSETGGATLLTPSEITVNPTFSTPDSVAFQFFGDFQRRCRPNRRIHSSIRVWIQFYLDITGQGIDLGPNDPVTLTGQFCGNGMLVGPFAAGSPTTCSGSNSAGIFPLTLVTSGNDTTASGLFPVTVITAWILASS